MDLLERALFNFGRAATTLFNTKMAQGKARLNFARPENRELWLAGWHYIKALLMKGTYRTALEWAKFLLALDPEGDPYCMRLLIHNYAIRCHELQYVADVYEGEMPALWSERTLSPLSHTLPSLAYAAMQMKEAKKCRDLLSESMQTTPWLFTRLFQEINLDAPPSIWGIVPRTDAETLFTEIYVNQTKDLWNTPAATELLMEVAHTIPKVDVNSIQKLDNSEMTLDVVRHVYVDDNPAIMKYAPNHLLHQENNSDFDPLPPEHNIISGYSVQDGARERYGGLGVNAVDGNFHELLQTPEDVERFRTAVRRSNMSREVQEDVLNSLQQPVETIDNRLLGRLRTLITLLWRRDGEREMVEALGLGSESEESDGEEMPGLVDDDGRPVVR